MAVRDEELCGKNFSELQNWIHQLSPLINYLINFPMNPHEKLGILWREHRISWTQFCSILFLSLCKLIGAVPDCHEALGKIIAHPCHSVYWPNDRHWHNRHTEKNTKFCLLCLTWPNLWGFYIQMTKNTDECTLRYCLLFCTDFTPANKSIWGCLQRELR